MGVTEAGRLGQNWVVLTSDRGAFASYVFLNRVSGVRVAPGVPRELDGSRVIDLSLPSIVSLGSGTV